MKYKKFCSILEKVVSEIHDMLDESGLKFDRVGPSFSIKLNKKKVASTQEKIDGIISKEFSGDDVRTFRKYNYCNKRLFLQFKRRSA